MKSDGGGSVVLSNQGIGTKLGTGSTSDNLDPGEALYFEIINPVLSPSVTSGAATFDGFTEAAFGGGATGLGYSSAEINGSPVEIGTAGTGSYEYITGTVSLPDSPATVLIDNVVTTAIGATIPSGPGAGQTADKTLTNRARAFDFSITYDPAGTPVSPTVCFTADDLGLPR